MSEAPVILEDHVREQLKQVIDPELFVNIVDLGLIYVVDIQRNDDGTHNVAVEMTMTSPMCPAGPQLVADSRKAIESMNGVAAVDIKVVMDPPWTPKNDRGCTRSTRDFLSTHDRFDRRNSVGVRGPRNR